MLTISQVIYLSPVMMLNYDYSSKTIMYIYQASKYSVTHMQSQPVRYSNYIPDYHITVDVYYMYYNI